jgi:UDP-N-acetyl-D-glucosamine/UDP-N-acetyl-D-galactosamine dehydrogenase
MPTVQAPARTIGVIGLGYVGLPLAVAFAERMPGRVIGFDINARRVAELQAGRDLTGEVVDERVQRAGVRCTNDASELAGADFFIVTVPTPVDRDNNPDLGPVRAATETIGRVVRPGAVVVYESTVYPGVTEEICGPLLERVSGLRCGVDFKLAYSPERIVPGDKERTFERIMKVVSGQDEETCDAVAAMYSLVVTAGVYKAPSIKVAEAAKVIENTQRDLNIALMNELSIVFDRLGIDTHDVLAAARTKWNFLHFTPGLVGGHCIGVDPYYLTARAEQLGVHPEVILAGRRVNNRMGEFVAHRTVKHMVLAGKNVSHASVLVAGFTFKENVPDVRNTGVVYLVRALQEYAIDVTVWDTHADPAQVRHEYGIELSPLDKHASYAAIVLAVPHRGTVEAVLELVRTHKVPVVIDVKAAIDRTQLPSSVVYWRL